MFSFVNFNYPWHAKKNHSQDSHKFGNVTNIETFCTILYYTTMMEEIVSVRLLEPDYVPGQYDVLCGRGSKCFHHPGNKFFRKLVEDNLQRYSAASMKHGKTSIIYELINHIRKCSPNGGFIKEDLLSGRFYEVGDFTAREKTSQAFRDVLHEKYKSSYAQRNCDRKKRRQKPQGMASTPSSGQIDTSFHDMKQHLTKSMRPYYEETHLSTEKTCNQVALDPLYSLNSYCGYLVDTVYSNINIAPESNKKMVQRQPQTSYALMSTELDDSMIQSANIMGYQGNQLSDINYNRPCKCFGNNTLDDDELVNFSVLPNSAVTEIDDTFWTIRQSTIQSSACTATSNLYSHHNDVDKYSNGTSTSLSDSFVFNQLMMFTDNGTSNIPSDFEPDPIPYNYVPQNYTL